MSTEDEVDPQTVRALVYGGTLLYAGVYVVVALVVVDDRFLQAATLGMGLVTAPVLYLLLRVTLPSVAGTD